MSRKREQKDRPCTIRKEAWSSQQQSDEDHEYERGTRSPSDRTTEMGHLTPSPSPLPPFPPSTYSHPYNVSSYPRVKPWHFRSVPALPSFPLPPLFQILSILSSAIPNSLARFLALLKIVYRRYSLHISIITRGLNFIVKSVAIIVQLSFEKWK